MQNGRIFLDKTMFFVDDFLRNVSFGKTLEIAFSYLAKNFHKMFLTYPAHTWKTWKKSSYKKNLPV